MANRVINKLTFLDLTQEDKDFILSHFTTDGVFDFNKIIPEPADVKDWHTWRIEHWDNKWNASEGYTTVYDNSITFVFETAWSAPYVVYKTLHDQFKFNFEVHFADEDMSSTNCGIISNYDTHYTEQLGTDLYYCGIDDLSTFIDDLWFNYAK